ncbi:MAG: molybdopterin molybdotransferase MoeA [Longimicrobiales bacterium]
MGDFETLEPHWLSYQEAVAAVLEVAAPAPTEERSPADALGRILAAGVRARATLPPHDNSAMDGFAVRSREVRELGASPRLPVAGLSLPGSLPVPSVQPGAAVRIMTGGPIPTGFDTVIRVEHTDGEAGPGWVVLNTLEDLGKHIRPAGQDMQEGDEVLAPGTRLHAGAIAVAVAAGAERVRVHGRPRIGVLSSGDELVEAQEFHQVEAGTGVPDTNRQMLIAAVAELGGIPVDLGIVKDDPQALRNVLEKLPPLDALVTTGGASMGEKDLLKRVLSSLSFELVFWRAKVRPGSPVSLGQLAIDGIPVPVFGLPGNPASAFVTFQLFVAPFVRACAGSAETGPSVVRAKVTAPLTSPPGLTHFYRVALHRSPSSDGNIGEITASLCGHQGSGLVSSLSEADGFAVVPEGISHIEVGDSVEVHVLPGRWTADR